MTTRNEDTPLPARTRWAYGAGGLFDRLGTQGLKDLGNPLFNLVLGINPALIGWVFVVTRIWDAFLDPLMGSLTDNARTRWGRRKPFMLAGTLLSAVAIVPIFWMPSGMSATGTTVWMIVTGILFFTAFTIFNVPYRALAYELTRDPHGKTDVLAARTVFAMVLAAITPWIFPLAQTGWFGSPQETIPWIAVGLALIVLVSGLVPTLWTREGKAADAALAGQRPVPLRESLARSLGCQPFRRLLGMGACTIVGVNLGFGFGSYVVIYHVFGGDRAAAAGTLGWFGTGLVVTGLAAAPLMSRLSRRIGKRDALRAALGLALCGSLASWWLFDPAHPWTVMLSPLLLAPGLISLWMLGEAMVADVSQAESERTGERTEAMFSAVFTWVLKTATAVAILGSNLLLNATGFDVSLSEGQAPDTILAMRAIYVALPSLGFVGSLLILGSIRIDGRQRVDTPKG